MLFLPLSDIFIEKVRLRYILFTLFVLSTTFCFADKTTTFNLDESVPVIIKSDYIEIDTEKKDISAPGMAELEYKDIHLLSDNLLLNTDSKNISAKNVKLIKENYNIRGDNLKLNLEDDYGEVNKADGTINNLKIKAEKIILQNNKITLLSGKITTCKKPHAHYTIHSQKVIITDKQTKAKNISIYLGKNKVLFLPYFIYISSEKKKRQTSFIPLPSFSYNKNNGLQGKIEYSLPLAPTTDMHLSLHIEKKEGLLGEVGISYLPSEFTSLSLSGGKIREKRIFPSGYVITKSPEFLMKYSPGAVYKNISFAGSAEYSKIKEENKISINKREIKASLSQNYHLTSSFYLSYEGEISKAWYDRKEREIFTGGVNFLKKSDNNDIMLGYLKRRERGETPFFYDKLEAQDEILLTKKITKNKFENKLDVRYDLQKRKFIDYVYNVSYLLDCFKWGVILRYKDEEIWVQAKITLL